MIKIVPLLQSTAALAGFFGAGLAWVAVCELLRHRPTLLDRPTQPLSLLGVIGCIVWQVSGTCVAVLHLRHAYLLASVLTAVLAAAATIVYGRLARAEATR